jgi:hypothetical protein
VHRSSPAEAVATSSQLPKTGDLDPGPFAVVTPRCLCTARDGQLLSRNAEAPAHALPPVPSPAAGQVRVKIAATSVNLSDWECLRGAPAYARIGGLRFPACRTLGSDIAGLVDDVGEGVTRFRPGDEVCRT